ncbi:MAG: uracil-DNA glycosylase family protein [Bacillota bacterium]
MNKVTPEEVYNCDGCKHLKKREVVFYGSDENLNKEECKVMMVFQNPGGFIEEQYPPAKPINRSSSGDIAKKHRISFYDWLGKRYYMFFRELFHYLKKYELIQEEINFYGDNILSQIYVTDACKCRVRTPEKNSDGPLSSNLRGTVVNSYTQCRYKYLYRELDELENLKLIILFGDIAFEAFESYDPRKANPLNYLNDKTSLIHTLPPIEGIPKGKGENHGSMYELNYKYRFNPIQVMRFMHPSNLYRYINEKDREAIIKESVNNCFNHYFQTIKINR